MTKRYVLTQRAADDLAAIADYSLETWGEEQMRRYVDALFTRFDWLARNPMTGRARPEVAPELRSWREGAHVIFYRVAEGRIEIIGVPHQAMDIDGSF